MFGAYASLPLNLKLPTSLPSCDKSMILAKKDKVESPANNSPDNSII